MVAETGGVYRLGTRLMSLASRAWSQFDLRAALAPDLQALRDATGETVHLAVPAGQVMIYIDKLESPGPRGRQGLSGRPGRRLPRAPAARPAAAGARAGRRDVEAQDALEVGKAVVAAEARVVAEEQQHGGERQRLRDDREVHALDARAEGEVAKDERQHARHQHPPPHGVPEVLGEGPVPGVALPVQEHHEVGQVALVDAVAADGAHQVHAVRIAAQREEQAVAQRQDAGVAPHQVQRQRSHRVAHELAQQRHGIG
ncbi:hypothetical protein G6F57_016811 [Rhizopus arrhizus]|nr:hypothetical protein G6F57_016811 [Rhizopus arrhizus]